jgi:hypothetical protein
MRRARVYLGFDTTGNTLTLTGMSSTLDITQELRLAEGEGSEGTFMLGGRAQLSADEEYIGYDGAGTFIQQGLSEECVNHVNGHVWLGYQPTGEGSYEMYEGLLDVISLILGGPPGGQGTFYQAGGEVMVRPPHSLILSGRDCTYELDAGTVSCGRLNIGGYTGEPGQVASFIQRGATSAVSVAERLVIHPKNRCASSYALVAGDLSVRGGIEVGSVYGDGSAHATFTQSGGANFVGDPNDANVLASLRVGPWSDGTYELSAGDLTISEDVVLGSACIGSFLQTGGTNTIMGNMTVGYAGSCYSSHDPGIGLYELSGMGALSVRIDEIIGSDHGGAPCPDSRGDFVQSGGTHTVGSFLYIGYSPGITGTYSISDGELSAFKLWLGVEGNGEFTQTGGIVTADDMDMARLSGSTASYELSGEGVLIVEDRMTLARGGDAWFTLAGGTLVADELIVGGYSGAAQLSITNPLSEVEVGTQLTLGGNAFFEAAPGSVIHMTHDPNSTSAAVFDNRSTSEFSLSGLANLELSFEGGADLTATTEIASTDLGPEETGFANNFALGTLRVGTLETPAHLMLVDNRDNGNRGGVGGDAEALYVDRIFLSAGSTLDLNGLHVYYHYLCNDGGTIELNGGTLEQVGLLGDIDGDGDVDLADLATLLAAYGTCVGDPGYNPAADLDCSGCINLSDLATLLANYGTGA